MESLGLARIGLWWSYELSSSSTSLFSLSSRRIVAAVFLFLVLISGQERENEREAEAAALSPSLEAPGSI